MMAYQLGQLSLQAPIRVRIEREFNGEKGQRTIDCTLGRLLFNAVIPQDMGSQAPYLPGRNVRAGDRHPVRQEGTGQDRR